MMDHYTLAAHTLSGNASRELDREVELRRKRAERAIAAGSATSGAVALGTAAPSRLWGRLLPHTPAQSRHV